MINLRFHIVSLVAVFFALAIGIAVGAAVVDQGVLNQTETRLSRFDRTLQRRNAEITDLKSAVDAKNQLAAELSEREGASRLVGRYLVVIGTPGAKDVDLEKVAEILTQAGANVQIRLALTERILLADPADEAAARSVLDIPSLTVNEVRSALIKRVVDSLLSPLLVPPMKPLVDKRFLSNFGQPIRVLHSDTYVVLVDSIRNDKEPGFAVARELVESLEQRGDIRLTVASNSKKLAADRGKSAVQTEATAIKKAKENVALYPLLSFARADYPATTTTVDNVDELAGRIALVLAVDDLGRGVVGHYGTSVGAKRLVPKP